MAKKQKYEELAGSVLELVGGKDNISLFTHCITRLRFNLKDESVVDLKKIEAVSGVLGCQWQSGQLQIIIGQSVGDAYNLICEKTGLASADASGTADNGPKKKEKFTIGKIFELLSGCVTPLIPVLIGCGMIKVVVLCLQTAGLIDVTGSTYQVLSWAGDAGFYFLPVLAGKTAAKKFGANEALGMAVGAMLIYPTFATGVAAGTAYTFLGLPIYGASYSSTVFPVILCVAVMTPIQKFFGKISPEIVRSITEPLCTLLVMIPLTYCLLGPAGAFLGTYISAAILWLYNTLGFIGVAVLAALMPFIVMTGMHTAFLPYLLNMYATVGYEPVFMPAMVLSNINQGAACAAVAMKTKNKTLKSTGISCAITAIVGGVTEPGMYGISLRFKTPMYGAMIGSAVAGAFAGIVKLYSYAIAGSGGLFALPTYIGPTASNLIFLCVAWAIGIVVTFIATMFLYKDGPMED